MYNGQLIIGDGVTTVSGNVECFDGGCPAPNAVGKGTLFNKDTKRGCLASDTRGEEGSVCVASVRGILHPVLCMRTHRCCIT